jgi:hypothetical protein
MGAFDPRQLELACRASQAAIEANGDVRQDTTDDGRGSVISA